MLMIHKATMTLQSCFWKSSFLQVLASTAVVTSQELGVLDQGWSEKLQDCSCPETGLNSDRKVGLLKLFRKVALLKRFWRVKSYSKVALTEQGWRVLIQSMVPQLGYYFRSRVTYQTHNHNVNRFCASGTQTNNGLYGRRAPSHKYQYQQQI